MRAENDVIVATVSI